VGISWRRNARGNHESREVAYRTLSAEYLARSNGKANLSSNGKAKLPAAVKVRALVPYVVAALPPDVR